MNKEMVEKMKPKLASCPWCGVAGQNMTIEATFGVFGVTVRIVCPECNNSHSVVYYTSHLSPARIIHDWNEFVEKHSGYTKPPEVEERQRTGQAIKQAYSAR